MQSNGRFAFTVEKGDVSPFGLTDSGRYSHTEEHIRAVARDAGFTVVSLEAGFLRNEYGKPVIGLAVLLQLI